MADDWDGPLPPEIRRYFDGESDPEDMLWGSWSIPTSSSGAIKDPTRLPAPTLLATLRDPGNDVF
jgi:hypothetical protein